MRLATTLRTPLSGEEVEAPGKSAAGAVAAADEAGAGAASGARAAS
ncbi:hypothetical protein HMPREF9005_1890, partial [Actinomyces sp. oral taxon 178 str. F0338]